jgi:centrosomal protein CEP76
MGVELMGVGEECKVPAGILYVSLQLVPTLSETLREDILETQLAIEHSKNSERERLFLLYSKQWWREFLEIREDHKNRLVKLFAQVFITLFLN